jgi:hypothetical protein
MENEKITLAEILEKLQFNQKEEAQAIIDYTKLIADINDSILDEPTKLALAQQIEEIIADELNHQQKLFAMFVELSEIEPNKE